MFEKETVLTLSKFCDVLVPEQSESQSNDPFTVMLEKTSFKHFKKFLENVSRKGNLQMSYKLIIL